MRRMYLCLLCAMAVIVSKKEKHCLSPARDDFTSTLLLPRVVEDWFVLFTFIYLSHIQRR